jgi:phage/plasmid-like protein (TIGR03299 family)
MAHNFIEGEDYTVFRTQGDGSNFWNRATPWWAKEKSNADTSWRRYGEAIDDLPLDACSEDVLKRAKLDWTVDKQRLFTENGNEVKTHRGLVRSDNARDFGVCGKDWHVTQNKTGFDFIVPFIQKGEASLDSAGSCQGGRIVYISAKLNETFVTADGRDSTEGYLLFALSHKPGTANHAKLVGNRTICNNTYDINVGAHSRHWFRWDHTKPFNAEEAQLRLGLVREAFLAEGEITKALAGVSLRKTTDIVAFFKASVGIKDPANDDPKRDEKEARNQKIIDGLLTSYFTQPGNELGLGNAWQALNAVTYHVDHVAGRNGPLGFASAQWGNGSLIKNRARKEAHKLLLAA